MAGLVLLAALRPLARLTALRAALRTRLTGLVALLLIGLAAVLASLLPAALLLALAAAVGLVLVGTIAAHLVLVAAHMLSPCCGVRVWPPIT